MEIEELYNQYFKDVYKFIYRMTGDHQLAEDITQETFIKAIKNLKKFKGDCKVSVWLCQIAKNTYFSHLKKNEKGKTVPIDEADSISKDADFSSRESLIEIHKALHELPEPYREVFTLKMFGELSLKEISQLFGKHESWGRVTYLRARQKLQMLMKKEDFYE